VLTLVHSISILVTLSFVGAVGIYSARLVKSAKDFSVGGRNLGTLLVAGALVGSFIGGTSTIGTAQIGYTLGISGVWFTLGAGISCIVMGVFLAKPLRESEVDTIPTFLEATYGKRAATWVTFFTSVGMLIQIAAQVLASIPLITSIFPLEPYIAAVTVMILIVSYVIFGGAWGTSLVGLTKTILLYTSLFVAGCISLKLFGGINGLLDSFTPQPWFNLFPHGISQELASGFSVIVGFTSTQSYLQVIFSGRDVKASRKGAVLAGLIIPFIGLASVSIGMFMAIHYPDINPAEALPLYVLKHLNPWLGGVVLATLLVSLVMTGSALALGVSTIWSQNIYKELLRREASDGELLWVSRLMVLLTALIVIVFVLGNTNSLILKWAFLSMAIRGVTVFLPLFGAVFFKKYMDRGAGTIAVSVAPTAAVIWAVLGYETIQPLYLGLILSFVILFAGFLKKYHKKLDKMCKI